MAEVKMKYGTTEQVTSNTYDELDLIFDIEKNIIYMYEDGKLNQIGTKIIYANSLASISSPIDDTVAMISTVSGSAIGIYYRSTGQWIKMVEAASSTNDGLMQSYQYNTITSLGNVPTGSVIKKTGVNTFGTAVIADFANVTVTGYTNGTLQSMLEQIGAQALDIPKFLPSLTILSTGWIQGTAEWEYTITDSRFSSNIQPLIQPVTREDAIKAGDIIYGINNEDGTCLLTLPDQPQEDFNISIRFDKIEVVS